MVAGLQIRSSSGSTPIQFHSHDALFYVAGSTVLSPNVLITVSCVSLCLIQYEIQRLYNTV